MRWIHVYVVVRCFNTADKTISDWISLYRSSSEVTALDPLSEVGPNQPRMRDFSKAVFGLPSAIELLLYIFSRGASTRVLITQQSAIEMPGYFTKLVWGQLMLTEKI